MQSYKDKFVSIHVSMIKRFCWCFCGEVAWGFSEVFFHFTMRLLVHTWGYDKTHLAFRNLAHVPIFVHSTVIWTELKTNCNPINDLLFEVKSWSNRWIKFICNRHSNFSPRFAITHSLCCFGILHGLTKVNRQS